MWDLSPAWIAQLRQGGVLVAPLWLPAGVEGSLALRKEGELLVGISSEPCGFMRLQGPNAGPERWIELGDWAVCREDPDPSGVAVLRDLLADAPGSEPAPEMPDGWFELLAMEEPRAIRLFDAGGDFDRRREGILDPSTRGLAVVEGEAVLGFGAERALLDLRERLAHPRTLDLRALEVEAAPSGDLLEAEGEWMLRRPNFSFALRERKDR